MKLRTPKRNRRAGFSLAEIMVVIVIIGLMATLVVKNVIPMIFKGNIAKVKNDISVIAQSVETYVIENNGTYPETLEALITPDAMGNKLLDYDAVPRDPWGFEYWYERPDTGSRFLIGTYGKDGMQGGEGDNLDITNVMIRNGDV